MNSQETKLIFVFWAPRFLSYAEHKGFVDILLGTAKPVDRSKILDPITDAEQLKGHKAHAAAHSALHAACRDTESFNAINNAITLEQPLGDGHLAWSNLQTIFKPTSTAQKHELEYRFAQCVLTKDTKNPDEWFSELDRIRSQLKMDHKVDYDDDKLISQIIYNVTPPAYQTTVELIKRELNRKVKVTLAEVQRDLRHIYGTIQQNQHTGRLQHNKGRHNPNDTLRAAYPKKTKSDCRICGKKGHKATDCWDHPSNKDKDRRNRNSKSRNPTRPPHFNPPAAAHAATTQSERPRVTCTYYNKPYHTEDKCFKNAADLRNRTSSRDSAELILITTHSAFNVSENDTSSKLDEDLFIGDSGATCHMRYSSTGMTD